MPMSGFSLADDEIALHNQRCAVMNTMKDKTLIINGLGIILDLKKTIIF